jgi:hypothetical protein
MSEHDENEDDERARRRTQLLGLLVVVVLVVGGLWLASVLGAASRIQDCVMSGRTNCVRFN